MPERLSALAVIPARGGSKRLPRKNILPFFEHPMLAYAVAGARRSGLFDFVVVSTEDREIARIARWYGARVVLRPPELAADDAGLVEVAEHVLEECGAGGAMPDLMCQLMPNCPLRRAEDIIDHHRLFLENDRRFQISVVPYRSVYPHWAMRAGPRREGAWIFEEQRRGLVSSHDFGDLCCPTGAIWWTRVRGFREQRNFYGEPWHLAPMDADRGIDIDVEDELRLAEVLVHGLWRRDADCPLEPIEQAPFKPGVSA